MDLINAGKIGERKESGCSNYRHKKKSKKWRRDVLNILTKYRVQDKDFKRQLASDCLHVCEKHFLPEEIRICKLKFLIILILSTQSRSLLKFCL